ncbi:thiosulfate sulfurtransferase [Rhizobium leguminosarum]|uniref:rhodanese-like domain-containing protein n=1 Tax=Rhizobium leguminosarum TaxID=384 RepID=UPI001C9189DD|nr:rhodanese-like domain-containing protein [Rhizobium leguminosarum]MBY2925021.1 thiosulfate sulfurtransferase [Rhizobium leguminosarum]MBY2966846.1 thiosulfate sulfurtransferase [Rhizobium leguminosarum]MBY2991079.1 thiosulfate sulfurtransferase [Rhizobium leguminosarum]MBY3057258.1 thiosulfate sulfurtransferase [Rhizobium leguminosarum]
MIQKTISPDTFRNWLADGEELAVFDIRDPAAVGYASPLFATNLPAEFVESEIGRFVPRTVVRTVLADGGDGAAALLAEKLGKAGWANVFALDGGIPAWTAKAEASLPTFDTPGVDFSLAVRDEKNTPVILAEELKRLRDAGEDVVVIDTRTVAEFSRDHVPGAVSVPGAELLLRFKDVVPSDKTKVVVSCAGLPRAILGAQTLIDAKVPNQVAYLHDGTKAWTGAGLELETGRTRVYGGASPAALDFAREHLQALSADDGFPEIDVATARKWAHDPGRTTYLLDVRTPEEFEKSHLDGTLSSEGGQLLGVAYRTIAVRGARVVLIDDSLGVRARTVAHWLQRRGFEIAILLVDFSAQQLSAVA